MRERGFEPIELPGTDRLAIGVLGSNPGSIRDAICDLPGVVDAIPVSKPYKQVTREWHPEPTVVDVSGVHFGDGSFVVIAGPCAVETREQVLATAREVAAAGRDDVPRRRVQATLLAVLVSRARARRPPPPRRGARGDRAAGGDRGADARRRRASCPSTPTCSRSGTRNAQNFALLEAVGRQTRPVLLKRGLSNTIEEWLLAAEYVVAHGNPNVVLCERGIRTFEAATRNTLDLSAVPVVKSLSHLPVIVDPSHATGHRPLVPPMALAAFAAGADGLMIEVHPDPENALSDGAQSLTPAAFAELMGSIRRLAVALDRQVATAPSPVRAGNPGLGWSAPWSAADDHRVQPEPAGHRERRPSSPTARALRPARMHQRDAQFCAYRDRRGAPCPAAFCPAHSVSFSGISYCRRHAGTVQAIGELAKDPNGFPDLNDRAPSLVNWIARDLDRASAACSAARSAAARASSSTSRSVSLTTRLARLAGNGAGGSSSTPGSSSR